MLSEVALKEFKKICIKDYGITMDDETTKTRALEFLKFFALLYKEPELDSSLVDKKYQVCDNQGASNFNRLTRRNSRLG